jgi:hypothetical protein
MRERLSDCFYFLNYCTRAKCVPLSGTEAVLSNRVITSLSIRGGRFHEHDVYTRHFIHFLFCFGIDHVPFLAPQFWLNFPLKKELGLARASLSTRAQAAHMAGKRLQS